MTEPLRHTPRQFYRHDPIGGGAVDFAALAPVLAEVGYVERSMLELITPDPNRDIPESIDHLSAIGWPVSPRPDD